MLPMFSFMSLSDSDVFDGDVDVTIPMRVSDLDGDPILFVSVYYWHEFLNSYGRRDLNVHLSSDRISGCRDRIRPNL